MAKRLFDLIAAVIGLGILAPLLLAISLWVKFESPGPIIFRQQRVGKSGRLFSILKFRSMTAAPNAQGPLLTVGADRRITRAGEILRRYKLDELPQLVNVIRGDMSIVGPRPEVPKYVALYSDEERRTVLSVRPGITDPASIAFVDEGKILERSEDPEHTYIHEILPVKLRLYQEYVRNRSFSSDMMIILRTLNAAKKAARQSG